MDRQALPAPPRVVDNGCVSNVVDLLDHVEFAQARGAVMIAADPSQFDFVFDTYVMNMSEPVIDQSVPLVVHRRLHAAAAVMPAHDNVSNPQDIYRELQCRKTIEIAVRNHVGDIPIQKDFPEGSPIISFAGTRLSEHPIQKSGRLLIERRDKFRLRL